MIFAALEVFQQQISSIAESMGAGLQRAAFSANIKERLDFSTAVFDGDGWLVAQAAHIPVHLGAMPASVAAARATFPIWQAGDVVALNDPYQGGSHLPDITTVSPVFVDDHPQPVAFLATRAHHADVGGSAPGSLPIARDLFGEGLVIPPVRLVKQGVPDADLLALICANSRTPEEREGDLEAQLGAHRIGEAALRELIEAMRPAGSGRATGTEAVAGRDGNDSPQLEPTDADAFRAACNALLAYSARRTHAVLSELPEGVYDFEDFLEGDGFESAPLAIRVALRIQAGRLHADFTGTASAVSGGMNAPLAVAYAAAYYVVACLLEDIPINSGVFAAVSLDVPEGSLLNPRRPAAVAAGNVETSQRVVDVLFGALSQAIPLRIPAASQGTMNNLVFGGTDPESGRPFTYYETLGGGGGGGPGRAGTSGLQVHMTNTRNTPVEALELAVPVRVEAYHLRNDSSGAGKWSGGQGLVRAIRFLAPARVTLLTERRDRAPWGLAGGSDGSCGVNRLIRAADPQGAVELPAKATFDVLAGDLLIIETPGGGGWGIAESS